MRTKTLLIAAAALVAATVSSEAQVYSANVVGYCNVVVPANPGWACLANPFDLDGVNNITNVLANVPKGTTIQLFTPGVGFNISVTRQNFGAPWSASAATTFIPPGVGFMVQSSGASFTNTFVGNVIVPVGGTNTFNLQGNHVAQLVGSPVPFSGDIATANGSGSLNLGNSLPGGTGTGGSTVQFYSGGFSLAASKSSFGAGSWTSSGTVNVGQGFVVLPGGPAVPVAWQQTLP
jgi:hypothetical protein